MERLWFEPEQVATRFADETHGTRRDEDSPEDQSFTCNHPHEC
jgi:hypothetical protein